MFTTDHYRKQAARLARVYGGDYGALQRDAAAVAEAKRDVVSVSELLGQKSPVRADEPLKRPADHKVVAE